MTHDKYIQRCFQLAALGRGMVAPNPLVGAVLVFENRIIGEGYHAKYGEAHAEVNCINSVEESERKLISSSTLYVSLEPCNHFGKTPPCSDLIIASKIKRVVISVTDPFDQVQGAGIAKLRAAGVEVITGVLEKQGLDLIAPFYIYHTQKRPYIILKWAQTADGSIGSGTDERLKISAAETDILVHRWRSEVAAIAVGTNTALHDNPQLNTRLWPGINPVRILIDRELKVNADYNILDGSHQTVVMNASRIGEEGNNRFVKISDWNSVDAMLKSWHELGFQSVLIEGGAALLTSFIRSGKYDEVRVITNSKLHFINGLKAPEMPVMTPTSVKKIGTDIIQYFHHTT